MPTSVGPQKKQENSRNTSTSASLTTPKPLPAWITTNGGKLLNRNTSPPYLPPEKSVCTKQPPAIKPIASGEENQCFPVKLIFKGKRGDKSTFKQLNIHHLDKTNFHSKVENLNRNGLPQPTPPPSLLSRRKTQDLCRRHCIPTFFKKFTRIYRSGGEKNKAGRGGREGARGFPQGRTG